MIKDKALQVAIRAAKLAGSYTKSCFLNLKPEDVFKKSKRDLVTSVDLGAEAIILKIIKKEFPQHSFLSEEKGKSTKTSDYLWVIDPLDGTTNFFLGNPLFAVSIALFYRKSVFVSAIHLPITGQTFYAQKNKGAYLDNIRLSVSQKDNLDGAYLAYCFPPEQKSMHFIGRIFPKLVEKASVMRQFGAASWEICQVAAGKLDAFFLAFASPWDVAGASLLVSEACGKISNFAGKNWLLDDQFFLATNGKIHNQLLKILNHEFKKISKKT